MIQHLLRLKAGGQNSIILGKEVESTRRHNNQQFILD